MLEVIRALPYMGLVLPPQIRKRIVEVVHARNLASKYFRVNRVCDGDSGLRYHAIHHAMRNRVNIVFHVVRGFKERQRLNPSSTFSADTMPAVNNG